MTRKVTHDGACIFLRRYLFDSFSKSRKDVCSLQGGWALPSDFLLAPSACGKVGKEMGQEKVSNKPIDLNASFCFFFFLSEGEFFLGREGRRDVVNLHDCMGVVRVA